MGMARAIWSGSISFGLVNVPVKVYAAVREHTFRFHQVAKGTGGNI
jgi:DNA end-binding protein Ku